MGKINFNLSAPKMFVLLLAVTQLSACESHKFNQNISEESNIMRSLSQRDAAPVHVHLFMSVDWEGANLTDSNIDAMVRFREQFPEVRLIHFICPSYFTQPGADAADFLAKFNSVYKSDIDQVGLHVHAWKSLIESAGVHYRDSPRYLNSRRTFPDVSERGHDVMLDAYSREELAKVFKKSLNILRNNGMPAVSIFRSGGWVAAPNVLEALVDAGISADSSAVPAEHLQGDLEGEPLYNEVRDIWPEITANTEAYKLALPSGREIDEYTDNLALADYVNGEQAFKILKERIASTVAGDHIYVHYGFHQETADYFSENFFGFISSVNHLDSVAGKSVTWHFDTQKSYPIAAQIGS